ncbi:MAG: hypothetical protein ACOY3P_14665 [Planctomycetota bacterium]
MIKWSEKNQDMAGTQAAMLRATRKAIEEARLRGQLIPQWRDGRVVWIRPEEIELPPMQDEPPPSPER